MFQGKFPCSSTYVELQIKTERINLAKFVKRQKVHGGSDDNVVLTATFSIDVPKTGFFVGLTVTPNLVYCPGDVGSQARAIVEDAGLFTVMVLPFDVKQEVVANELFCLGACTSGTATARVPSRTPSARRVHKKTRRDHHSKMVANHARTSSRCSSK
jgi:hypothetical protein